MYMGVIFLTGLNDQLAPTIYLSNRDFQAKLFSKNSHISIDIMSMSHRDFN